MATRKLGDLHTSAGGRSNKRAQYTGVKTMEPYGNSHHYTELCAFLVGDKQQYPEQPPKERPQERSYQPETGPGELELPTRDFVECLYPIKDKVHHEQQNILGSGHVAPLYCARSVRSIAEPRDRNPRFIQQRRGVTRCTFHMPWLTCKKS